MAYQNMALSYAVFGWANLKNFPQNLRQMVVIMAHQNLMS